MSGLAPGLALRHLALWHLPFLGPAALGIDAHRRADRGARPTGLPQYRQLDKPPTSSEATAQKISAAAVAAAPPFLTAINASSISIAAAIFRAEPGFLPLLIPPPPRGGQMIKTSGHLPAHRQGLRRTGSGHRCVLGTRAISAPAPAKNRCSARWRRGLRLPPSGNVRPTCWIPALIHAATWGPRK
jgi:hypothetical protein